MGTQVLHPQDCLIQWIRPHPPAFSRRRSSGNYCNYYYSYNHHAATSGSSRRPVARPDQRKRASKRSSADDSGIARSSMEKVTILRRGQSLDSSLSAAVKSDVYAGSVCAVSPSPSALPLPSFPTKKQSSVAFDDSATRDLRRLLRLE